MWVAGGLAVVIALIFGALYLKPESKTTPSGNGAKPVRFDKALADQGEQVASSNGCSSCHTTDGSKSVGPTWKDTFGTQVELSDGQKVKVDAKYIEAATFDPNAEVREGFGPSMPSYEGKLSDEDVEAIVEYIKSLND